MGKQIGTFIRDLREKRGLSQGDVAKLLKLKTAQSISNIERGVSPLPRAKIKRLAEVLGVKQNEIVMIVLQEVQDRYSKAAGVQLKVQKAAKPALPGFMSSTTLSTDERALLKTLAEKLTAAKSSQRSQLKLQVKRILR